MKLLLILKISTTKFLKKSNTRGIGWVGWLSVAVADGGGAYSGALGGGRIGSLFGPKGATVGAVLGGVIGGVGSSYKQYKMARDISNFSPLPEDTIMPSMSKYTISYAESRDSINNSEYVMGLTCNLDSCSVKCGILHNQVLDRIMSYSQVNHSNAPSLPILEDDIVSSSSFENMIDDVINTNHISVLPAPQTNLADLVFELFKQAVFDGCVSLASLQTIVEFYTDQVNQEHSLSQEEKQSLKIGFAVIYYSFAYWSEKWPYVSDERA